ncbi:MAG: hypothetical protein ABIS39_00920 [Sphingomicrobium sp.]
MAVDRAFEHQPDVVALAQVQRVVANGCETDSHLARLLDQNGPRCGPDLADAIHLLCALHGHYPGLIAVAAHDTINPEEKAWLAEASDAFESERGNLLRLTAAVGPIPGTPGAAETESSLSAMRHALDTLARSERSGCALGAACALVADWRPIRRLLDRAGSRGGLDGPVCRLPDGPSLTAIIGQAARSPAAARALAFGSEQMLLQHRALFALLEARSEARAAI